MASIVEGHQVGVIVPVAELLKAQTQKWLVLQTPPVYAVANPVEGSEQQLIDAGKYLLEQGADVLMLDCPVFINAIVIYCKSRWMSRFCCPMC